jgi:SAM-dependent methyltransferase
VEPVASANQEAIEAWDGVLFDRFVQYRHLVAEGLGAHGDQALALHPPKPGDRVLDIGCGFGDTAQRIAGIVGRDGEVVGVDASERFIESATAEAREAGIENVRFMVRDIQAGGLEEGFDFAFSRMGTMFFANPVPAMRNIRDALVPGGRLCMVVWRAKIENEWTSRAEAVVEEFVTEDEDSDELTCGPGPFSMANADTLTDILRHSGFTDISLTRCDLDIMGGTDLDEALDLVMSIGPAGEILRLQGDRAAHLLPQVDAALREGLGEFVRDDGQVWAPASTWIAIASRPMT